MLHNITETSTTIIAPATATGGATIVIRLSGSQAIEIADKMFRGRRKLAEAEGYTLHYGTIRNEDGCVVDDVVVALFRAPNSYTGDDTVEITTHGSEHICSEVLRIAIGYGAKMATAGEFTRRAFLAGKMDLSRAEAVADIIASDSRWSHNIATTQMRGGYSAKLQELRGELLRLCSLLELELDFSEEDVEFADRSMLRAILAEVEKQVAMLIASFSVGNAIKNGVNVAIVGEPNVGKSTLLNALIEDDRAMVSDVAGTTRDTIEATTIIDGIRFRFVDTAGLRTTDDQLEQMGITRTYRAIDNAHVVLHLTTADNPEFQNIELKDGQSYIQIINKIDKLTSSDLPVSNKPLCISAKQGRGIDRLREVLRSTVDTSQLNANSVVVSNMRHYDALKSASEALSMARTAINNNLSAELISEDIRQVLHHLGEITGEITSDDILHSIFSKFCIGK
ncbi:MAG: tRNA uridine-5-carboxymethylaminomethyl(34) synthesis GTPase MnmE [Alistipes sp.]|nr:tRNA uridine-5-carboxymethylaminomethyl(34) synthesis GTPase MnmE [Alistipes sp.]